jgi:peptidyl-prolyl cis-trans isomerase SurA
LINPGDISQPVLTPYGWHIIKLIKKIPLQPFEEMKEELTSRIKQDSRSEIGNEMLIGKLKRDNHFSCNEEIRDIIVAYADSSLLRSQWKFDDHAPVLDSALFSINHENYAVRGFFNFVQTHQKIVRNVDPIFYFNQLLQEYINQEVIQYEKDHLADKYFEYRMLSREYEEGILLFEIMDQKIWSFSMEDTAGLDRFYRQNIENYQWDTRLNAVIFRTRDLSTIDKIRHLLQKPYYDLSADPIIFEIPDEGLNNNPFSNQLDSLYREAIKNEDWLIEITLSDNNPQQIYSILNDKNYIPDKFIIKSHGPDKNLLKIVSKSKKDLDKSISDKSGVNLQIESGIYQKGEDTLVDMIDWKEGIHELSIEEDEYLIYVEKVLPPMNQELEEIKGKVISDYQNYLDKMWVQELRGKYKVQINDQALNDIIDQFEK